MVNTDKIYTFIFLYLGVAFDILRTMSESTQNFGVKNVFQNEVLKATKAPYSPGFANELGNFLIANHVRQNTQDFDEFQKNFFRRFLPSFPF